MYSQFQTSELYFLGCPAGRPSQNGYLGQETKAQVWCKLNQKTQETNSNSRFWKISCWWRQWERIKNISWSWSDMGRVGIGWAWRQNCEIAGGGKALLIKADSVKWFFFSQIKMLKHNKCTAHLTSCHAPYATQSPPCPVQSYYSCWAATGFSVLCSSRSACVHMCVSVRVCTWVHRDKKIIETGGFWH